LLLEEFSNTLLDRGWFHLSGGFSGGRRLQGFSVGRRCLLEGQCLLLLLRRFDRTFFAFGTTLAGEVRLFGGRFNLLLLALLVFLGRGVRGVLFREIGVLVAMPEC
jgi:hypothetical protein